MAQIIGLPKLSPTMEEGVLVKWVKKEGDSVEPGDLIAEVETDKANMDFNLEDEGVLLKLLVEEGATVKLGAPVAILGEEGEDIAEVMAELEGGGSGSGGSAAPAAETKASKAKTSTDDRADDEDREDDDGAQTAKATAKPAPAPAKASSTPKVSRPEPPGAVPGRLLASPLAKSLAIELGIDLRAVKGSGPGGRIVERDVRAAADGGEQRPARHDQDAEAELEAEDRGSTALAVYSGSDRGALARSMSDEYEDRELSNIRKTIAQRLTAAKQEIPHYRLSTDFDAAPLRRFRARLNKLIGDEGKVTVNDLLIKGAALALRRVPEVNAAFLGDAIRYYTRVHMGVAVALDRGLITPVVRNADLKGIGVIGGEVRDLVQRAKDRQLKAHEIQGSTFTISNLGMFGINHFDAIINPPEAAILAVGRIRELAVVKDGQIGIGQRMNLTLSCDHRVVDGALGARFLDTLVDLLERPETLAL